MEDDDDDIIMWQVGALPKSSVETVDKWIREHEANGRYLQMFQLHRIAKNDYNMAVSDLKYNRRGVKGVLREHLEHGRLMEFCELFREIDVRELQSVAEAKILAAIGDAPDWRYAVELYAAARRCSAFEDLLFPAHDVRRIGEIIRNIGFIGEARFQFRATDCDPRFAAETVFTTMVHGETIRWKPDDEWLVVCNYNQTLNSIYLKDFFYNCSDAAKQAARKRLPDGIRLSQHGMMFVYCLARMCGATSIHLYDVWRSPQDYAFRSADLRRHPEIAERLQIRYAPYDTDGRFKHRRMTRSSLESWYSLMFKAEVKGGTVFINDLDYVRSIVAAKM